MQLFRIIVLTGTAVLLSGCYIVKIEDTVTSQGELNRTTTLTVSEKMRELMLSEDAEVTPPNHEDDCDDVEDSVIGSTEWKVLECGPTPDGGIAIRSVATSTKALKTKKLPDGSVQYSYELYGEDDLVDPSLKKKEEEYEAEQTEFESEMGDEFFEISYRVTMPGKITDAGGGKLLRSDVVVFSHEVLKKVTKKTTIISVDSPNAKTALGSTQADRICARIAKFKDQPTMYKRILERVQKRFDLTCQQ
jgi:hypothetical protein